MILARIIYHEEDGAWWAESPQFPRLFAAADSLEETNERVREALPLVAEYPSYVGMIHIYPRDGRVEGALGSAYAGLGHAGDLVLA